jgi:very-short-patch-repair endonuclease
LSEAAEQIDRWNDGRPSRPTGSSSRWTSILARIVRQFRWRNRSDADTPARLDKLIERLRRELVALSPPPDATEWDAMADAVATDVRAALHAGARLRTTPSRSEAVALSQRLKDLEFNSRARRPQLTAEDARLVLRHRPVWAISTLSVSSRVPLVAGLFDYVIFDEASQCDIASALPLLGRARSAVIVGDPTQLGFIPQLSQRQEHALMDAAGLGRSGRHLVAQSNNSLFAFVRQRDVAQWHFLADQFRSTPDIVAYLNDEFYEGRLLPSQDPRRVRLPNGYKPGIAWHDVPGQASREDGGSVNHSEADAILQVLTEMIRERGFTGSIGVLSPFNSQVGLLIRRIRAAITEPEQERVKLRVSTIDKFQGGEVDVILFSLVVAEGVHAATLGFYARERRRLNVAISRARALCLIFGDKSFVQRSGIALLVRLAEWTGRPSKPRQTFDSEWERRIFEAMRRRGLDPIPQYPVAGRYLDFALDPEGCRLDLEVDGRRWHADPDGNRKLSDRLRDRALIALGWKVRRFWVHELADNMEQCLDVIERDLDRT